MKVSPSLLPIVLFGLLAGWAVLTDRFLHDEGMLTWIFASATAAEPVAAFFFQKTRPPISALYAPFAAAGLGPFLWAHVLIGGLALAMWASTARGLGLRHPGVAVAILGLSPLMVAGSAAGVSNTDAVAGIALFGWLWVVKKRPHLAGVVLGTLPWIRAELAVLGLVFGVDAVRRRAWSMLAGCLVFPCLYLLAGALYHGTPLWFLSFPPALPRPMPGNPYWQAHAGTIEAVELEGLLLGLTPVLPLLGLLRPAALSAFERHGLVFVGLFVGALVVMPLVQAFNFDQTPRYFLPVLPFVALLGARAVETWTARQPETIASTVGLLLAGAVAFALQGATGRAATLAAVGLCAAAVTLARLGRITAAKAVAIATLGAGPVVVADATGLLRRHEASRLEEMVTRLGDHAPSSGQRRVYTNEPLLAAYLQRQGRLPWAEVHYVVQVDQEYELEQLTNGANGQREALWRAFDHGFYGIPVRGSTFTPQAVPVGSLFALTRDARLDLTMVPEQWAPALSVRAPGYGVWIAERVESTREEAR